VAALVKDVREKRSLRDADRNAFRMFTGGEGGTDEAEIYLAEGDKLSLGNEALTVWHTPGHTEGSICLYAPGILLSGDTVFLRTIGRTDLPGGSPQDMRKSLCRIFSFEKDVLLYSGHGPASSLAREKKYNPYANWEF
jgi:glyoxylase-like metal-dependent hydrolase (beta-lactamase superfamily II)